MNDKKLINWVINDLEMNPDKWRIDWHSAVRLEKPEVSVRMYGAYYSTKIDIGGVSVGGQTAFAMFFGYLIPWRRRVVAAARKAALKNAGIE